MPDAELSVVGECVTQEMPIVGGTGEGYGLLLNTVLVIVEKMVGEHTIHRQSQILYCHGDLVVGFFGIENRQDMLRYGEF